MAFKNKTLIEVAMFAVLEGMQILDDDGNTQVVKDLQCDINTRRITLEFVNGDKRNVNFSDPVSIDADTISLTTSHNHPQNSIQPNKQQFKRKNRD